jgi:transposase-like protein
MAQHFLLCARARTISLREVYAGGEEKAWELFKQMRWPDTEGKPVCPRCGSLDAYDIKSRRKHECRACRHQFSATSGTILASRKMAYVDLVAAIVMLANSAKGISALQLARNLHCQAKTAFVLMHKLREALASETKDMKLHGVVEVDGGYFGGHIRPANLAKDRVDRRLARYQTGKRRVVVVMRQRGGRTLTTVVRYEHQGIDAIKERVSSAAQIHADEASHWDALHGLHDIKRINHQVAYSQRGACTNWAESFFARMRLMVRGQHHHVSPHLLHAYASQAAWIEDHRKVDNAALTRSILILAMAHPVSRIWKGYWQRLPQSYLQS